MIIRDKQELKRCVKQAVRRAQVAEVCLNFDVNGGVCGVEPLLHTWAKPAGAPQDAMRRACAQGTPFCEGAATMFAALDALELPVHQLNNAQTIQQSYDRDAYLREVLDAMHASRVLVRVNLMDASQVCLNDDRLAPLLAFFCGDVFIPGRYGVDYASAAQMLAGHLESAASQDILAIGAGYEAIRYCLIPLSEDTGCVLHLYLEDSGDLMGLIDLLRLHPQARAIVSTDCDHERELIEQAKGVSNMLVLLSSLENMRYALERLGTWCIPYASRSSLPEQMLGRWINAREEIWQTLLEAYLPLARSGYELTSEAIARDVNDLLGGSLTALYHQTV